MIYLITSLLLSLLLFLTLRELYLRRKYKYFDLYLKKNVWRKPVYNRNIPGTNITGKITTKMIQIYEDLPDDIKYKYNSKWVISNNLKDRIHDEHLDMIKIPGYDIKYFFGHKIEYIDSEEEIIRFLTLEQERDEKLNELLK